MSHTDTESHWMGQRKKKKKEHSAEKAGIQATIKAKAKGGGQ
jgi:hypothetical protein